MQFMRVTAINQRLEGWLYISPNLKFSTKNGVLWHGKDPVLMIVCATFQL